MTAETNLVDVKEAVKLLDLDTPQQLHHLVKKAGVMKQKKGRLVYFNKDELLSKVEKFRSSTGTHKPKKGRPTAKAPKEGDEAVGAEKGWYVKTVEKDPRLLAWNKGTWRGWCFAAVEDLDEDTITVLTDYGKQYFWPLEYIVDELAHGKIFFLDPAQVLRFLIVQILRKEKSAYKEGKLVNIIKQLNSIVEELEAIQNDAKKA